jgi:D-arabinose 1-dehydrogenase-like Zn-dependent alcohol dehydrogenase
MRPVGVAKEQFIAICEAGVCFDDLHLAEGKAKGRSIGVRGASLNSADFP